MPEIKFRPHKGGLAILGALLNDMTLKFQKKKVKQKYIMLWN